MNDNVSNLINSIGGLRISQTPNQLESVINALNAMGLGKCIDVIYTNNTDKMAFGIMVTPVLTSANISSILIGDSSFTINQYFVEVDSKVFSSTLDDEEIAAIMLYNISHMTASGLIDRLKETIDIYFATTGTQLKIQESLQYQQILALGFIDTLIKFTNCLYLDRDIVNDPYIEDLGLSDSFESGVRKFYGDSDYSTSNPPKLFILNWCFILYGDVEHQRIPAINQLKRSKQINASYLYNKAINNAIDALYKIDTDKLYTEAAVALQEKMGFFQNMKLNGLRSIEDDFYEYVMVARNADTADEAMYALRQINARLAILEDYIRNNDLDEMEKQRWTELYIKYRQIRDDLAKKKIYNKRNYGVFFDYNQLDRDLDED